jgi:hypothetical protein
MVRELRNKTFLMLTIIVMLVLISGCDSTTNSTNANRKYYTGYGSVEMSFLQDSPPLIFYYDSQASDYESNTIPIFVQLYNRGSSDTFGALFVHGFDPNIISVDGYSPNYPNSAYGNSGLWSSTMFTGWFSSANAFSVSGLNIPIGNSLVNIGFTQLGDRRIISFSSFNVASRSALFNQMRFATATTPYSGYTGISTGVVQANIGAALNPITEGMFSAYGWNYGWLKKFALEGRNRNNPGGGTEVIEFPATILTLPPSLEEFRQRIMITSCFDYATHASTMVCLDPEPYSNVKKACRPVTVAVGGGQGAPVAITTVEQRPGRGRTTFIINVNLGKRGTYDELYDYWSLYKCNPASGQIVKTTDKNVVYIGYVYLSNFDITMSCIPDQMIRLDDAGRGQITCSIVFPAGVDGRPLTTSAYEAPLEIELWYGYSKTIYKDMIIRRI